VVGRCNRLLVENWQSRIGLDHLSNLLLPTQVGSTCARKLPAHLATAEAPNILGLCQSQNLLTDVTTYQSAPGSSAVASLPADADQVKKCFLRAYIKPLLDTKRGRAADFNGFYSAPVLRLDQEGISLGIGKTDGAISRAASRRVVPNRNRFEGFMMRALTT
jgi:hypothetical protein